MDPKSGLPACFKINTNFIIFIIYKLSNFDLSLGVGSNTHNMVDVTI